MDETRMLCMSAFEAALVVRSFRLKNPDLSDNSIVATAKALKSDLVAYDYAAGLHLERNVPINVTDQTQFFRNAVDSAISLINPWWLSLARSGRNHVLKAMQQNSVQCLRAAGLLGTDADAVNWWDALAAAARARRDESLLETGRAGERLSLAHERVRLRQLGIDRNPTWVALEDNLVGYDILSFDLVLGSETNRLIEVKASKGETRRFYLSRNEWLAAERYNSSYVIHHWLLDSCSLRVLTVDELRSHIPTDHGHGAWQNVEIVLDN